MTSKQTKTVQNITHIDNTVTSNVTHHIGLNYIPNSLEYGVQFIRTYENNVLVYSHINVWQEREITHSVSWEQDTFSMCNVNNSVHYIGDYVSNDSPLVKRLNAFFTDTKWYEYSIHLVIKEAISLIELVKTSYDGFKAASNYTQVLDLYQDNYDVEVNDKLVNAISKSFHREFGMSLPNNKKVRIMSLLCKANMEQIQVYNMLRPDDFWQGSTQELAAICKLFGCENEFNNWIMSLKV